jgi:WD40 repeat protein
MAEQLEPVRRRVALKVIKLGMDTRQVVARFEAERQALALMDHPSIARVFDAGATEAGRPFFVMELVRGVPITEFCDARRFNTRDRLDLFVPVCQAVQHAHQKGVIHRDLKPSNILVTEQDGRAVPKIIDFGVAKAIEDPLTDKTLFTRFHQFLGTPAYMSPEQAGLGGLDIDTRSDIYSLGVLLYEMLTGQPPLDPRQLREAGYEAILKTIREVEPPKPSTQLRRRLSASPLNDSARARLTGREAQIEEDLDWIVLKALEKDRARRYETANGLAADLRRYLENEPIAARPPSALYRIGKLARRHKLVFAAAGAVSAAVVVGLVATAWQGQRAERHFEQARRNAYASEMNTAFHAWEAGRVLRARELLERQRPASGSSLKDLRGFDWRYLWSRTRPAELFTLTNATDWGFALSGDGKTLVGLVASSGDTNVDWHLQFWNLPERRLLAKLKSDTAWIFNGAFSPDDSKFVVPQVSSTDTNYFLQLWRAESRQLIARLPMGIPLGAAFSPDGKLLAASSGHMYVADQPGALWLWDAATGRLLRPPLELPLWAYQVAFSPDSASLAVSCGDGVARVLDVASSNTQAELRGHNGFVAAVAFTHDGTRLVTGDERGYVRIWDWANGYPEKTFKAHDRPIYQISITADNQRFVTASRDFTARLWDRNTGQELSRFAGHNGGVTSARLLPGDETLVTASQDHNVKVWNARPRREGGLVIPNPKQTDALLTSGGRYVAVVDWRGSSIAFHDATTGAVVTNLPGLAVAALRDGSQLAVLSQKDVVFYDPIELAEVGRTALPSQLGGRPCVSPDDRWLAFRRAETGAGERRTRVVVVDVTRRSVVRELETDIDGVDGWAPVYFARGGRLLLTARMQAQQFAVWDTATWRRVKVLSGFPASEYVVATVSPDGGTLAVSGFGGRLHLWDLERLQPLPSIDPGAGDIYSLAFEPRGEILALGAIDGTIRLWNLQARQELGALHGHSSLVRYLNFSPDGRTLLSGSHDASIRLWRAPSWEEIKNAEARVPGPSRAQRRP